MVLGVSRFDLNVDLVANPLGLTEDAIYHHDRYLNVSRPQTLVARS